MPSEAITSTAEMLAFFVKTRKLAEDAGVWDRTPRYLYSSFEDFVLSNARPFDKMPLPRSVPQGTPKMCFHNCMKLLMRRKKFREQYDYVEGYTLLDDFPLPVHHGWLCPKGKTISIDPTSSRLVSYLGIPFTFEYVAQHWQRCCKEGPYSLIDNWTDGFPLLKMSQEELEAITAWDSRREIPFTQ